jgi:glycosyltransferase involved in cell wall biosynthesis
MLKTYVFSYNRGRFLENAVASVFRCMKNPDVTVIDDGSTDAETISILARLSAGARVERKSHRDGARLGALYANMQTALDEARSDEMVLFIQDDTQLVRPVDDTDYDYVQMYFAGAPDRAFLLPTFIRGVASAEDLSKLRLEEDRSATSGLPFGG